MTSRAPTSLPSVAKPRICGASLRCSSVIWSDQTPSSRLALLATARFRSVGQTGRRSRRLMIAAALIALLALSGCLRAGYIIQAGLGQVELWGKSRPLYEVLADSDASERTRVLLAEVPHILAFARQRGLPSKGSYTRYVDLGRRQVVWFMATSQELAFEPLVWNFPIVGSFTYLGWFGLNEARRIGRLLENEGWDVHIRPSRAYSTGGWFRDPILSTMLLDGDDAFRYLSNTLVHELTHSNLLVKDQSTFNESVATFVGDVMAEEYLIARFGADSAEVLAYRQELADHRAWAARMASAYRELAALYKSHAPVAKKRARKQAVLDALERELQLSYTPNNASLIGFATYNAGMDEFGRLLGHCGQSWPRFFAALRTLTPGSFATGQQDDIDPVIARLRARPCPAAAAQNQAVSAR
jgi:predicted aminopeptidase